MKKIIINYKLQKTIQKLILPLIAILFWIGSIVNLKLLETHHGAISVRYPRPVIKEQEIEQILMEMNTRKDRNIPKVTLWQKDENIRITQEELGTAVSVSFITVAGDMTRVYPDTLINGAYLSREDYYGCVIDENTAYELFHSLNVVGMNINLIDKEYIIRGVMKSTGNRSMIIQDNNTGLGESDKKTYSCMELEFNDYQNAIPLAEKFVLTNGLNEPSDYINGYQYQIIGNCFVHIPLWICVMGIIIVLFRKVYALRASLLLSGMGYLGVIMISILLMKVTKIKIYYPASLIPNQWSDFDFWAAQWKRFMGLLQSRAGMIQYDKEIILHKRIFIVISSMIIVAITEVYMLKDIYRRKS